MTSLRAGLLLPLLVLASCAPEGPVDVAATRAAVDSLLRTHSRLIVSGDVEGIVNQYTPDAVVRSNHAEPLRGHAAIRSFVQNMLQSVAVQSLTYETEDLAVQGDSAWHVVTFGLRGTIGNQPMADSGGAYILWTRDTVGVWRIKHDILNSRLPLPPLQPSSSR